MKETANQTGRELDKELAIKEAYIASLREALKPFAEAYSEESVTSLIARFGEDEPADIHFHFPHGVTLGDLHRVLSVYHHPDDRAEIRQLSEAGERHRARLSNGQEETQA